MMPYIIRYTLFLLVLFASNAMSLPEPQLSEHIATIIQAEPIKRVPPKYPIDAARKGKEGWVKISFVVDENGQVLEPVIQDSSGLKEFEKAALRAVNRWQYSPATVNEKPIQQCKNMVQLDFALGKKTGVTRRFMKRYRMATAAIDEGDLTTAADILDAMQDEQLWNSTESAFFWLARSNYAKATDNPQHELKSVRRALAINNDYISKAVRQYLLQRDFALSVKLSEYKQSLDAYERLYQLVGGDSEALAPYTSYAQQIRELVHGSEPMVRPANINQNGLFFHELSRNIFSVEITSGDLDEVQIRCDSKLSRFTAKEKSEWHIPESWGQCAVFVYGSTGTEFNVVELGEYTGIL